jgi:hypothetical protein
MGLFRPDRNRTGHDPVLNHKITIFVLGAVVALVGMSSGNRWLVYLAIGILAAGLVLRLAHRNDGRGTGGDPSDSAR